MVRTSFMRVPMKRLTFGCSRGREKPAHFLRQMLAVGVEQDDEFNLRTLQPMTQTGLDRLAFAEILRMNNDLRAAFTGTRGGCIAGTVVDHKNVIELGASALGDCADVSLLVISGNRRGDVGAIQRPTWLRGRAAPSLAGRGGAGITDPSHNGCNAIAAGITNPVYNGLNGLPDDRMKIRRVIRAAHERTGGDMGKTFAARNVAVEIELLGRNVLDDRQMLRRRPKILTQRQHLATNFAQIVHRLEKFRLRFAQAEHHPALGRRYPGESSLARRRTCNEVRYFARDLTTGVSRSTVSRL